MNEKKELGSAPQQTLFRFGRYELDLRQEILRREGQRVRIQAQPLKLLGLLASRNGDLVRRDEIQAALWPGDTYVDFDQGINHCIRQIRAALHDDSECPAYVETVPRRGYRFIAQVEPAGPNRTERAEMPQAPPLGRKSSTWIAGSVLIGVIVAVATFLTGRGAPENGQRYIVAVLPFEDLGPEAAEVSLGDALTEELITQLSRRYGGHLGVIARTSAMAYKRSNATIDRIGRELNADFIVEGSVRRSGERVRFTAQLIRVSDQSHLWASSYELPMRNLLRTEREVSDRIADALALKLLPEDAREWPSGATDTLAYDLYLEARNRMKAPGLGAAREALDIFRAATDRDPGFAQAWAASATAWRYQRMPPHERMPRAREAAEKALALDDRNVLAWFELGWARFYYEFDFEGARQAWIRVLEIDPGYAGAHHAMASLFTIEGKHDEAIASVNRALALDPLHPMVASDVGWFHYFSRRYEEAILWSKRTLERFPEFYWSHRCILQAAIQLDDLELALQEAEWLTRRQSASGEIAASAGPGDQDNLMRRFWERELQWLERREAANGLTMPELGLAQLALGETEGAVESFERAYDQRTSWLLPFLTVEPLVDSLRGEPRFQNLLARISVAGYAE